VHPQAPLHPARVNDHLDRIGIQPVPYNPYLDRVLRSSPFSAIPVLINVL
jgi:hypothetical protein